MRKKYSNIKKSRKVLKKLESIPKNKPPGIGIDIQGKSNDKYKIRISGARDKDQLQRMLDFMNVLIYLYVETYLLKKPERQKLKEKLKKLTHIAKRRHRVADIVEHDSVEKSVKTITKRDSKRIGFKPEKGQNQWTRSCQNSGDDKKRRPQQYTKIDNLIKLGYKKNKKSGFYEKVVKVKDKNKFKDETIRTVKLNDIDDTGKPTGNFIHYACDPKENGEHFYVGFLSRSNNPYGFCMPCCFKKDQMFSKNDTKRDYYLECVGKKEPQKNTVKSSEPKILGDQLYILQDTNKIQEGRLAFLAKDLDFFFNYRLGKVKDIKQNYLTKSADGYYFKMGSRQDKFAFLHAVSSLINMSVETIKKKLINALENDKSDLMFTYLNNGNIRERFETRKKYIEFIKTNHILDYDVMNNLISIPGVLSADGLNIVLFQKVVKKVKKTLEKEQVFEDFVIVCQNYEENFNITSPVRDNLIIISENKNYNPIVLVTKKDTNSKDIIIDRIFKFEDKKDNVIHNLIDLYRRNCTGSFLDTLKNKKKNPIAKKTFLILNAMKNKNYHCKYQIIDARNRCKFLITNNLTIVPVSSSGSVYGLMIVKHIDPQLIDIEKMYNQLSELDKLNNSLLFVKPIGVFYEKTQSSESKIFVTALKTISGDIIPILPKKIKKSWAKDKGLNLESEPLNDIIDKEIEKFSEKKNKYVDIRTQEIDIYKYKNESYELFRLNFSNYLQFPENEAMYKKIVKLVNDNTVSRGQKRRQFRKLLYRLSDKDLLSMYDNLVEKSNKQTGGKYDKLLHVVNNIPDLTGYKIKNTRDTCDIHETREQCNNNVHCRWSHDTCYFSTTKELLVEFVNKVSEELSEGKLKSDEILQIDEYFVSDIVDMNRYTERPGQKIIKSTNTTLKKMLEKIFGEENVPQIGKRRGMGMEGMSYTELNSTNPLRDMRDLFVQNIIDNNMSIFRTYVNGYYWTKHPFYDLNSRNLGFYNPIQTDLANYFRSLVSDWLLNADHKKEIIDNLTEFMGIKINDRSLRNYVLKMSNSVLTTTNCFVELYVLSRIQKIPIYIYNDSNRVIYLFDNGIKITPKQDFNSKKFKKYHDLNIKNNSIHIRFSYLSNNSVPDEIETLYFK